MPAIPLPPRAGAGNRAEDDGTTDGGGRVVGCWELGSGN